MIAEQELVLEDLDFGAGPSEPTQATPSQVQVAPAAQPVERPVIHEVHNLDLGEEELEDSKRASHHRQKRLKSRAQEDHLREMRDMMKFFVDQNMVLME